MSKTKTLQKKRRRLTYGCKLLGAYIGSDEYVLASLESYFSELKEVADSLKLYPDIQGRYIMFRYCFFAKPLHLMRTTRPDLIREFNKWLLKLQRSIIESFLNGGYVSEALFDKMCLRVCAGGIGIHKAIEISPAAYTASWISYLKSQNFDLQMEALSTMEQDQLIPRLEYLRQVVKFFKLPTDSSRWKYFLQWKSSRNHGTICQETSYYQQPSRS